MLSMMSITICVCGVLAGEGLTLIYRSDCEYPIPLPNYDTDG